MNRKLQFLLFLLVILSRGLSAQIYDPVSWEFSYEKKGNNRYDLIFAATIEEGSHIYSMDVPENGPIPTSFIFDTMPGYKLEDSVFEVTKPEDLFDEAFGFRIKSFSNRAEFRQTVYSEEPAFTVSGTVNYMSCNKSACSPPKDVEFSIRIGSPVSFRQACRTGKRIAEIFPDISPGRLCRNIDPMRFSNDTNYCCIFFPGF